MTYIALIKKDSDTYIMLNKDNSVTGFSSLRKGLDFFENGYNSNHRRGYEASMSAALHHITFQPRIVEIEDNKLMEYVGENPSLYQLSHVSGFYKGVKLLPKFNSMYKNGVAPKLIG